MRIIGGSVGGRRVRAPRGLATRPTSDRVREAVFNILGPPPEGSRALDLYAGAGGLGLEALSRGAAQAVFVDEATAAVRCIEANLRALGFGERGRVLRAEVAAALTRLAAAGERFDWVFVDPPYASDEAAATLTALGGAAASILRDAAERSEAAPSSPGSAGRARSLSTKDAVVVVEHDRRHAPGDAYGALARTDRRRYGDTEVSFYGRVT